jgi:multidrug efflux pump subunit AcrA (membrane-fusion protein)
VSEATHPLAVLLGLEEQSRTAVSAAALAFVMVNDSRALVEYRQAALLTVDGGLTAVSGVASADRSTPFALWLERIWRRLAPTTPMAVSAADLEGEDAAEWGEWLPRHALWVPLGPHGTLMFARDGEWHEAEITLLARAAAIFAFAWGAMHRPSAWRIWRRRLRETPRLRWGLAAAAIAVLLLPVRLSVLAPAEIVPHAPAVVRAPLDGVVERVLVQPNQAVAAGDLLLELDRTTLVGRVEVARKARSSAQAEFDQVSQQAFFDPKAKAQLAVLKARIDERAAELAQLEGLLGRSQVRAPRSGTAVLDDPAEWNGRPVAVGERILMVADPAEVEVEIWLSPADLIALEPGAPVTVFLNAAPLSAVAARLLYVTYEAVPQPDGHWAHRVRAAVASESAPTLGQKGTARLDGNRVPLIYWLLRRPLAVVRTTLGI